MADKQAVIDELHRRSTQGKFSEKQQTAFQELQRRGVMPPTPGTPESGLMSYGGAMEEASRRIQEREERLGRPLGTNEQLAIQDTYKRMARVPADQLSNRDFYAEQQAAERQQRNTTVAGRAQNFGLNFMQSVAAPVTGAVGLAAPEAASDLREQQQAAYNPGGGLSGLAGQAVGEGVNLAGTLGAGPAGVASIFGARGAGTARTDIAEARDAGEDISGWEEAQAAALSGLVEGGSGLVGAKAVQTLGRLGRPAARALGEAAKKGPQAFKKAAQGAGLAVAEGGEEAATEAVLNAVAQTYYDPDRGVLDGVAKAGAMGVLLAPVGGAVAGGAAPQNTAAQAIVKGREPGETPLTDVQLQEMDQETGQKIAEAAGMKFEGMQEVGDGEAPLMTLTDPQTNSTLMVGPGESVAGAVRKSRQKFEQTERRAPDTVSETSAEDLVRGASPVAAQQQQSSEAPTGPTPTVVSQDRSRAQFTGPLARLEAEEFAARLQEERGPDVKSEVRPLRRGTGYEVQTEQGILEPKSQDIPTTVAGMTQTQQRRTVRKAREAGFPVERKEDLTDDIVQAVREGRQAPTDARVGGRREADPTAAQPPESQPERRQRIERRHTDLAGERQQISQLYQQGKTQEAEARVAELQDRARRDSKGTGLLSGETFNQQGADIDARVNETGEPRHMMLTDIANLTAANSTLGHEGATAELQRVADVILDVVGPEAAFRTGGDEMGVIFPEGTSRSQARKMMKEIEKRVGTRELVPNISLFVSGSIGTVKPDQSFADVVADTDRRAEARKKQIKKERGEPSLTKEEIENLGSETTRDTAGVIAEARAGDISKEEAVDELLNQDIVETQAENGVPGMVPPDSADALTEATVPQIDRVPKQSMVAEAFEKNLVPLGSVVRRWAPRMWGRMKQMQSGYRRDRHDADYQGKKLETLVQKNLSKEQQQRLMYLWETGQWTEAHRHIDEHAGDAAADLKNQFDLVDRMKEVLRQEYVDAGGKVGFIENHFPRALKPGKYQEFVQTLRGEERSDLDLLIEDEVRRQGRPLTDVEKAGVANKWLAGHRRQKPGETSPRILSKRSVEDLTFEQWQEFYQTDFSPLYTYFDRTIYNTHKAKLFGKKSVDEDMTETLGRMLVEGKYGADQLTGYQQNRLRSAIGSAYTGGELSPNQWFRWARDAGYMGTLLDPTSAAIQFGDLTLVAARDGTHPMLRAIPRSLREKVLTAKNLGMEHLSEEYGSHGRMSSALRRGFKAVGFHKIDTASLTVSMVSARDTAADTVKRRDSRRFKRWAETWGPAFGQDFPRLVRDLENGVTSDLVQDYAYMEASETRPNDILDMPENYAKYPNARILWQLKGFMMKQFDFLNQRGYRKIARGVRREDPKMMREGVAGLTRGMMMLSLAGASFDWLRDWMLGRNPDFSRSLTNGLIYTHMGSLYLLGTAGDEGPGTAIVDFVTPPSPGLADTFWKDLTNGTYTSLKHLPFGKTIYSFTPEAEAKQTRYARMDALKAAARAYIDGDPAGARTYINAFNDEMKNLGRDERLNMSSVRRSAANRER